MTSFFTFQETFMFPVWPPWCVCWSMAKGGIWLMACLCVSHLLLHLPGRQVDAKNNSSHSWKPNQNVTPQNAPAECSPREGFSSHEVWQEQGGYEIPHSRIRGQSNSESEFLECHMEAHTWTWRLRQCTEVNPVWLCWTGYLWNLRHGARQEWGSGSKGTELGLWGVSGIEGLRWSLLEGCRQWGIDFLSFLPSHLSGRKCFLH
jgi:hypothetical protein